MLPTKLVRSHVMTAPSGVTKACAMLHTKIAYEGGEIVYWLKGEISQDDSTLIRNAKRVLHLTKLNSSRLL